MSGLAGYLPFGWKKVYTLVSHSKPKEHPMSELMKMENVSMNLKANVYFDGKVVSHGLELKDGSKKTVGLIYPGTFTFNTAAPERMDIIAGSCQVRIAGQGPWNTIEAGSYFEVPGNSSFDITVDQGLTEYLCSFK
jgi:uncharacterized protein YaiE (UPF0345 family)